jgi:hypothetical protein
MCLEERMAALKELSEIFPYMQFLKVPHSSNFLEFKSRYLRNDGNGELGALLQKTMLKR